ncbi:MAG: cobalamin-binding protein [Thermodesulfobacteriota bacterium]|nr:cobalamin-binding protein [Thermodesulfobacteriota bacterium]
MQKHRMNHTATFAVALSVAILCIASVTNARVYIDKIGREVSIPPSPQRIVSLAPNITETLFALGLDEKIVGVTKFCDYPQGTASKRKVGGLVNPSLERIVSLNPNLVIGTADGNRKETVERLERAGLPVYIVNPGNLGETLKMILDLGEITGRKDEASRLVDNLRKRIDHVTLLTKNSPRPAVFFQVGKDTIITAGKNTLIDGLIKSAGGKNIAGDSTTRYPRFSMETIILKNPDIIIISSAKNASSASIEKTWGKWKDITAVKKGNLYVIDPDLTNRPAPRIVDGLETLAGIIHPEIVWYFDAGY